MVAPVADGRRSFCCLHQLPFTGSFVVETAEVQDAVYDDAVQFFIVGFPELLGIGTDGVERYDKVAVDLVSLNHRGQAFE